MSDWKFDLDEVGPEGGSETGGDEDEKGEGDGEDAQTDAEEMKDEIWLPPIEPERPDIENVVPFLLGVGIALFIFLKFL